jgi:hypothetical protein
MRINWSGADIAVHHARALQDIQDVLPLRKEQAVGVSSDGDAEKKVKCAEVLEGKFPLKSRNGPAKELLGGGRQNNVVDIE